MKRRAGSSKGVVAKLVLVGCLGAGGPKLVQVVFRWSWWPSAGPSCFPVELVAQCWLPVLSGAPVAAMCFSFVCAFVVVVCRVCFCFCVSFCVCVRLCVEVVILFLYSRLIVLLCLRLLLSYFVWSALFRSSCSLGAGCCCWLHGGPRCFPVGRLVSKLLRVGCCAF